MYMKAYPKAYHQKFISARKNFDEMSEENITQYFQILHREEEETKPKGTLKAEGNVKGTGGHTTSKTRRDRHRTRNDIRSHTHHERSSEHKSGPKIVNQCTY